MNIENMMNKLDNYSKKNYNHLNKKPSHELDLSKIKEVCFTQQKIMEIIDQAKGCNNIDNNNNINNNKDGLAQKSLSLHDKKKNNDFFYPTQNDSLFWCFYILKNGFSKYEMIDNKHFVVEKEEKYKYINIIRNKKERMKINKIKPFSEIENDLANNQCISVKTFFALCIVEEINIILVHKRKIYKFLCSIDTKTNVVHQSKNRYTFGIEIDAMDAKVNDYLENYHVIDNFENSLRTITYYKVEDLLNICKKLQINTINTNIGDNNENNINVANNTEKKKLTKKDLYNLITLNF